MAENSPCLLRGHSPSRSHLGESEFFHPFGQVAPVRFARSCQAACELAQKRFDFPHKCDSLSIDRVLDGTCTLCRLQLPPQSCHTPFYPTERSVLRHLVVHFFASENAKFLDQ